MQTQISMTGRTLKRALAPSRCATAACACTRTLCGLVPTFHAVLLWAPLHHHAESHKRFGSGCDAFDRGGPFVLCT